MWNVCPGQPWTDNVTSELKHMQVLRDFLLSWANISSWFPGPGDAGCSGDSPPPPPPLCLSLIGFPPIDLNFTQGKGDAILYLFTFSFITWCILFIFFYKGNRVPLYWIKLELQVFLPLPVVTILLLLTSPPGIGEQNNLPGQSVEDKAITL